jgi:lysophospholipase L1-like esterase
MGTYPTEAILFLNAEKKLDKKYTIDGLHLNAEGYKVWKDILTKGHYLEN